MKYLSLFVYSFIWLAFWQSAYAQTTEIINSPPEIKSIEPREIFPGMALKIEGYRFGGNGDSAKIIFRQNANEYTTRFNGASWESANLSEGLQELNVTVPEEITPGKCQLIIDYNGHRSPPVQIDVTSKPRPPQITAIHPRIITPEETLWITGVGFNNSDRVEMVDANGNTHNVGIGSSSSADTSAFTLSRALPDGLVTLRILEGRSGTYQESNSLTFKVSRHITPLDILAEDLDLVAPGQSVELVRTSDKPLEGAKKIEILLRQGTQEKRIFLSNLKNIFLQISDSFTPGKATIQNRVWKKGEFSEWSEPIEYNVAEKPVEPTIWSYTDIPPKAEAMFKQDGAIVKISSISYDVNPKVGIPKELKDGDLEILTRYWDGGKFTEWKSDRRFNFKRNQFKETYFVFSLFNKTFYIGKDSPEFFQMNRGEYLRIDGSYFVKSADEIRLTLNNKKETITLKPVRSVYINLMLFKIPANIPSGDWNAAITNQKTKTAKSIQVKLRIN